MTSTPHPADNSNDERRNRRCKPEWARQVLSLYGDNELTREIASARTTNLGSTLAIEASAWLTAEAMRASTATHPDWCRPRDPQHISPNHADGWVHVGSSLRVSASTCPCDEHGRRPQFVIRAVIDEYSPTPRAQITLHTNVGSSVCLTGQECVELIGHLLEMVDACGADLGVAE